MSRLIAALSTALMMAVGLITLWGLLGAGGSVLTISNTLLQLTVITVALTILIGILNLFGVHLRRIVSRARGWFYSLVLLASAAVVIVLWLLDADNTNMLLLESVQVAVESALAGLVLFALVYGAYRLMRKRVTWAGILFTLSLLVILVGALPLTEIALLSEVRAWLLAVPVSAGARGILLGIALATVVTGTRVLIGQDRSYRE